MAFYLISKIDLFLIFYCFENGITISQKSLFLHIFSWHLSCFFKGMKTIQTIRTIYSFWGYSLFVINYLFFAIGVNFWNIIWTFFHFFNIQNIKSNYWIIELNVFRSSFFDGYFIPSQSYLFMNGLIFKSFSVFYLICLWFSATVAAYWTTFSSWFSGFTFFRASFLFVFLFNVALFWRINK